MNETGIVEKVAGEVRENWGWLLFMGIALIVLGTIGLYMAGIMTLASVFYLGILVVAGGVFMLIDAFKAEGWKAILWEILIAITYIAAGIIMIANPAASAVWFTMFIAAFLFSTGVFRIIMGLLIRTRAKGWGWTVAGGVASIFLALIIFAQWPISGLWVIGLFIAIEMIMQGISMVSIANGGQGIKEYTRKSGSIAPVPMADGFSGAQSASDLLESKAEHVRLFLWFSCSDAAMRQRRWTICPENSFVMGI
ncbi:MAG: HdeD family acid-resistance protein [Pseudomonadota bacterium]